MQERPHVDFHESELDVEKIDSASIERNVSTLVDDITFVAATKKLNEIPVTKSKRQFIIRANELA